MAKTFEHDWQGYRKVMKSDGVEKDLLRRARAVRQVVIDLMSGEDDWEVTADVRTGANRAGAMVSGVPMRIERQRRVLGTAIDAARK